MVDCSRSGPVGNAFDRIAVAPGRCTNLAYCWRHINCVYDIRVRDGNGPNSLVEALCKVCWHMRPMCVDLPGSDCAAPVSVGAANASLLPSPIHVDAMVHTTRRARRADAALRLLE